jgi:cytochrome c-type biogenesis protein CcmH
MNRSWHQLACGALLCGAIASAHAEQSLAEREARLAEHLRCLVCQNQTLAESNAPLAADMRREIRKQLAEGKSEQQIIEFFERRYGAFVRYDPPFKPSTWLLWLGPYVLLAVGLLAMLRVVAGRRASGPAPLTPAERNKLASMVEEDAP